MSKIAIIVPYRNRKKQLDRFLNYFKNSNLDCHIFVVEQDDEKPFNQGKLLNVGFLEAVKDLELLVVDPIQSFCSAPTNDNEVGQLWSSLMQMIASKFNTCVASIHHMSKQGLIATNDPLQSRMAVRGASSFVDASRWVLSLFLCEEEEAQAICLREGISYDRMKVVRSAVVKANSDADMTVKTLIRKNGFLELLDENKEINWT